MGPLKKLALLVIVCSLVCFYAVSKLLYALLIFIKNPRRALRRIPRDIPPVCLLDPSLGSHEYVTANGIKFHCVSAGDRSKPLMLFLHGFPEFWFSWRYQMREFSRDYHVVAIDMRGYGDTDRPPRVTDYTFQHLTQDIAELILALGHASCVLVAHDWGGVVAWRLTQRHPELVDQFVVMNCPHGRVYKQQLEKSWGQLLKAWLTWLPEMFISMQDYQFLESLFTSKHSGVKNNASFPPDVVEAYKYTFSKPGALTAPINYYRCMFSSPKEKLPPEKRKISVPTLIIWGDDDHVLQKEMADSHNDICMNLTVKHIPNCSHWVQQDAPDLCNQYMRQFLTEEQQ